MSDESGQGLLEASKHKLLLEKWLEIRLEIDKALFLASLGISGYILTYLAAKTDIATSQRFVLALSLAAFFIEIFLFLLIMRGNAVFLQKLLNNKDSEDLEARLAFLDHMALILFFLSLLATIFGSVMDVFFTGGCNG